jgi:hypothetical protein
MVGYFLPDSLFFCDNLWLYLKKVLYGKPNLKCYETAKNHPIRLATASESGSRIREGREPHDRKQNVSDKLSK